MSPEEFYAENDRLSEILADHGLELQNDETEIHEGKAPDDPFGPAKTWVGPMGLYGNQLMWGMIAWRDGDVAASAAVSESLYDDGSCSVFLDAIHVAPQYRGGGVAASMISALEAVFADRIRGMSETQRGRSEIACEAASAGGEAIAEKMRRFTASVTAPGAEP